MKFSKKLLSVILSVLLSYSLITATAITTTAYPTNILESMDETFEEYTYGDFSYAVYENMVIITDYTGKGTKVSVPSNIYGMPVVCINNVAFMDYDKITSVSLPDSIQVIGEGAFFGCTALKSINLPDSISYIEYLAFGECQNLNKITIPKGLKTLSNSVFAGCTELKSITIPDNITDIEYGAFCETGLINVKIPRNVQRIQNPFLYCQNLQNIEVDSNNKWYISENGILFTQGKRELLCYPAGKKETTYKIPESVTDLGAGAFSCCENLTDMIIPNTVDEGEDSIFEGCVNLKNICLSNRMSSIGRCMFLGCKNLKNIFIPASITYIQDYAFHGCNKLSDVYYTGTQKNWESMNINNDDNSNAELYKAKIHYDYKSIISLDKSAITLGTGQMDLLKATIIVSTKLQWKSSNAMVASVDANGKVTAKKTGRTRITVTTEDGQTAVCQVNVLNAPTKLTLNKNALILGLKEKFTLIPTVPDGEFMGNITYTSSDTSVATVRSNGVITTKSTGTTIITATTYNGKKATFRLTVKKAPTSISINRKNSIMGLGETFYLEGSLAKDEASRVLTFSSNHPEVATVTDSGIVMAKSIGTALVSITTYNGQKATCRVTVRNAPTSLTFNQTNLTLKQGETFYLESQFNTGEYARTVIYNSPDKSVATISGSGVIMAENTGTVNITGKTYNGKTQICTVTVTNE